MKISQQIKKIAMPNWFRKGIFLEFEVVDHVELRCKLHVEVDDKFVGNIFLEQQGKRILKSTFEHKRLSQIKKIIEEERFDIEREFGHLLYRSNEFANPPFTIQNDEIKLNLKSPKRITKFVKIIETNPDFNWHDDENWGEILPTLGYHFDKRGLQFNISGSMYYQINYSDLLFYD